MKKLLLKSIRSKNHSKLTTHQEIQKQISPIVVRKTAIEASQARLEAKQTQMSDQLTEGGQKDSKRTRGEELVGVSVSSKAITRFQSRQDGESKRNERRVEDLNVTTKMQQSLQVTTVADEDQGILEIDASAEASQYLQTLKVKGRNTTLFYKDPKIHLLDSEVSRRIFAKENPRVDLKQLRQMEEDFKNSMKTINVDIAVISQEEDERSLRSEVIGTADKKLKGKEKIEEKSKISKSKAKVVAKKKGSDGTRSFNEDDDTTKNYGDQSSHVMQFETETAKAQSFKVKELNNQLDEFKKLEKRYEIELRKERCNLADESYKRAKVEVYRAFETLTSQIERLVHMENEKMIKEEMEVQHIEEADRKI
ncbi:hypothetical protein AgCh_012797 [Apium graveolens]